MSAAAPEGLLSQLTSRLDFAALLEQRGRLLQVQTALPDLALIPERLTMVDQVDAPFALTLDCISTSAHFELKRLIGQQISVRLLGSDGAYRPWHGYVVEAMHLGSDGGLARYRLEMSAWLSFLAHRHDSFVFQDRTALQIIEDVFADYPQAHFQIQVTDTLRTRSLCTQYRESDLAFVQRLLAEEGLSYRFEHLSGDDAKGADERGQARHRLVISDRQVERVDLGTARFTSQHVIAKLAGQRDAVTAFSAERNVSANAVTVGSWNYKHLSGTAAQQQSTLDLGELPGLEQYTGSGAYRYENTTHAERAAALALAAHELRNKRHEGLGSARHFAAGCEFTLIDHPLFGANASALNYVGAALASRQRPDNAFTLTRVEHHAANNLGAQAAQLLKNSDIENGSYRNAFEAVPAAAPLAPAHIRKPTAHGAQTALVVGIDGEALTTERDHRVKVQFPWQRGERPLSGGMSHESDADPSGNAPGNESAGTWVRIALPAAGANHGAVLVPRVGTEVLVDFLDGDIDRPVIAAQLYNGADTPPFVAGIDSGVNHPGVISGMHVTAVDGGWGQWLMDDATGQLRTRIATSQAGSELSMGHLIQQASGSAQRGAWRGSGFEANTRGWMSLRAGQGLLVSSTTRAGTYGSAQSTQMDAAEALAQLKGGYQLGQRLDEAARSSQAHGLMSQRADQSLDKQLAALDPKRDGKHASAVNSQDAVKPAPDGRALGSDPVEAFAQPLLVLDTPSRAAWSSGASIASYSGQHTALLAQSDLHQSAAHTYSGISGTTTSLYTGEGGVKAIAANGKVSVRAHTDELHMRAQQELQVVSVNDEIRVSAPDRIEFIAGNSGITLNGPSIELTMPGAFTAKGASKAFLNGSSQAVIVPNLPSGLTSVPPDTAQFRYVYHDGEPVKGADYTAVLPDGSVRRGRLDAAGFVSLEGVPAGAIDVTVGPDPRPYEKFKLPAVLDDDMKDWTTV